VSSQALVPVGPATNEPNQDLESGIGPLPDLSDKRTLQNQVVELYGHGYTRGQIAKALVNHLAPKKRHNEQLQYRYKRARSILRRWEHAKWFRDQVWDNALVRLDLENPRILQAVASSAKRGRVDAAKLALEITARHVANETRMVTAVQVNIANGLPRPGDQS
jgi:hypothetical protein